MKLPTNFKKYLAIPLTCIVLGLTLLIVLNYQTDSISKIELSNNQSFGPGRLAQVSNKTGYNSPNDFTLTSHLGNKVSLSDYSGKSVILLFGYTSCPDVCPMQLYNMVDVMENLGDKAKHVQVLFVTIDPERDTPEVLKKHLDFFHPSFVGLTGTHKEIFAVAKKYKVRYIRREMENGDYSMHHTSKVYLIDSHGVLQEHYMQKVGVSFWNQMSEAILKLINETTKM